MARTTTRHTKGGFTTTLSTTVKDKGYERIKRELKKLEGSYTLVGWPGEADSELKTKVIVNEFGSIKNKIPARPFNRKTFDDAQTQKEIKVLISTFITRIYKGNLTVKTGLARLGEWYAGKIKQTIMSGSWVPLKPATIRRKKSSRPLIDTGEMKNSVTHKEVIK